MTRKLLLSVIAQPLVVCIYFNSSNLTLSEAPFLPLSQADKYRDPYQNEDNDNDSDCDPSNGSCRQSSLTIVFVIRWTVSVQWEWGMLDLDRARTGKIGEKDFSPGRGHLHLCGSTCGIYVDPDIGWCTDVTHTIPIRNVISADRQACPSIRGAAPCLRDKLGTL